MSVASVTIELFGRTLTRHQLIKKCRVGCNHFDFRAWYKSIRYIYQYICTCIFRKGSILNCKDLYILLTAYKYYWPVNDLLLCIYIFINAHEYLWIYKWPKTVRLYFHKFTLELEKSLRFCVTFSVTKSKILWFWWHILGINI